MSEISPPLYLTPKTLDPTKPFEGDCFRDRKELADRLTTHLNRLPYGGVIAIDAPWGEGKSWFGLNWHHQLKLDGYRTSYINAFELDYIEDPFAMLAAEILTELKTPGKESKIYKTLRNTTLSLAKTLVPSVGKFAVNTIGQWGTGQTDFADQVTAGIQKITEESADAVKRQLSKRIEQYAEDKKSVSSFKESLAAIAIEQEKPIIIFIDELDRCRPDFSVKTIERIKHFFEVKNVIFILLINKDQLCAAVGGQYGNIDTSTYLGKFLHLTLRLPKNVDSRNADRDANTVYCRQVLQRFGFDFRKDPCKMWADMTGALATHFEMSLRDIERCVSLLSLCGIANRDMMCVAWIAVLKIKKPELFAGIRVGKQKANEQAIDLLNLFASSRSANEYIVKAFLALHHSTYTTLDSESEAHLNRYFPHSHYTPFENWKDAWPYYCGLIDFVQ